ncbi:MAG TPA: alanine dehydrogenase [Casimicrobiaceae bacterium]|nr:alanine dehydrogenase [Casimicrobiaceae bacterium]
MDVGVPCETKDGERRVALTPDAVHALAGDGHRLIVGAGAGARAGFGDAAYAAAGGRLSTSAAEVFACELVVKVKELQRPEWDLVAPRTTVFGFAHLARDPALLDAVLARGLRVVAFEAVRDAAGALPILAPMSRIAGRLAPFVAQEALGGSAGAGVLVTGVDEVAGARVVVLGAGNVGAQAALTAAAMGARVDVYSRGAAGLAALAARDPRIVTHQLAAVGEDALAAAIADADAIIGAVLEPGRLSPRLVTRAMLRTMRPGSALVDIGIDQGGIAETSRMTTMSAPTYVEEGIVHSCIANLPARVPRTATLALAAAALPHVRRLAMQGIEAALDADPGLAAAALTWDGSVVASGLAADSRRPLAERGRGRRDRHARHAG